MASDVTTKSQGPLWKEPKAKNSRASEARVWSRAVRERDKNTCQRCGVYGLHLPTHHIAARTQRPDLRLDVKNGVTLCWQCHSWVHANPERAKAAGFMSNARYEFR